ncbi:hypothetical protein [Flavisericum labens]|uniref:hypothetical protein n=1 Tax=Flavisericum labens TaxID=3377112 RepID=UPI00387B8D95
MKTKKNTPKDFYQNLGKLFYAIAAADGKVEEVEFRELKKLAKNQWQQVDCIDESEEEFHETELIFEYLNTKDYNAEKCFSDFVEFKNENPILFTQDVKKLILKTASAIANSFSSLNKSELIMLAKLDIEFKK